MWYFTGVFPLFSQEDPPSMQEESAGGETTYRESYDDVTVDRLLNHIPLVSQMETVLNNSPCKYSSFNH